MYLVLSMEFTRNLMFFALLLILSLPHCRSQSPSPSGNSKLLDGILQDYAFRAFDQLRPRTGIVYDAFPPSNFSGITLAAIRLRSGSLKRLGVPNYKEFSIPVGVVEQPYVERLILVYQNLGNWSSLYYSLPGYTFLAPVLGLLAYSAANLSARNLPELEIMASMRPILINFTGIRTGFNESTAKCVWFDLDGLPEVSNLTSGNLCSALRQGHFSVVVESTVPSPMIPLLPPPPPNRGPSMGGGNGNESKVWKIVGSVIGGFIFLVLLGLFVLWMMRYRKNKKVEKMEQAAEMGEALHMTSIGDHRAPLAMGTRTQPILENEYVS